MNKKIQYSKTNFDDFVYQSVEDNINILKAMSQDDNRHSWEKIFLETLISLTDEKRALNIEETLNELNEVKNFAYPEYAFKSDLFIRNKIPFLKYMLNFFPPQSKKHYLIVGESPPKDHYFYDFIRPDKFRTYCKNQFNKFVSSNDIPQNDYEFLLWFSKGGFWLTDAIKCRVNKTKKLSLNSTQRKYLSVDIRNEINILRPSAILVIGKIAAEVLACSSADKMLLMYVRQPYRNLVTSEPKRIKFDTCESYVFFCPFISVFTKREPFITYANQSWKAFINTIE